jgi:hypothetical protein
VNININVTINNLQNILRPGSPLLNNLNQVMGKLNQVLDSLRGILDRLGQQPPGGGLYGPFFPGSVLRLRLLRPRASGASRVVSLRPSEVPAGGYDSGQAVR